MFLFLQNHILGYIRDIFDFRTSDYSSIGSLCDSMVRLAKERSELLLRSDVDQTKMAASFDEALNLMSQELQEVEQS